MLIDTERILAASRERRVLDCRDGGHHGELAADDVRAACLAVGERGDPFGVRIANARITGRLDLRFATVPAPLHLLGCRLEHALRIGGAQIHELLVVGGEHASPFPAADLLASHLPGLLAGGITVRRDLNLSGTHVTGRHATSASLSRTAAFWLTEAQIGGRLLLADTTITTDADRAVQADRTVITGDARLIRLRADAEVRMLAVQVGGSLALFGAELTAPLDATQAVIGGQLQTDAGTHLDGGLRMPRAQLRGGAVLRGTRIRRPGELAADLSQAQFGAGLDVFDCDVQGALNLAYARIAGPLRMNGTTLSRPRNRHCVIGVGARIEGDVLLIDLVADGGCVSLRSAAVDGVVNAERATITNPGDKTLSLYQARVVGNVQLYNGFRSEGVVILNRTTIEGRLRCDGGTFSWDGTVVPRGDPNPHGAAVAAISADVRGGISLGWDIPSGGVNLVDASTTYLADDPRRDWPASSRLAGFAYQRFAGPEHAPGDGEWRPAQRAAWLAALENDDPRPWGQVARVLAASGDHTGAEDVLIARRRYERRARLGAQRHRWRRALDVVEDGVIGYGHRPQRVLLVMLALIAAVVLSVAVPAGRTTMRAVDPAGTVHRAGDCGAGQVRCLEPLLYAVDTVVPIIDLKQRETWYPAADAGGRWLEWLLNLSTILGWVASTVFALTFARLGRGPG